MNLPEKACLVFEPADCRASPNSLADASCGIACCTAGYGALDNHVRIPELVLMYESRLLSFSGQYLPLYASEYTQCNQPYMVADVIAPFSEGLPFLGSCFPCEL